MTETLEYTILNQLLTTINTNQMRQSYILPRTPTTYLFGNPGCLVAIDLFIRSPANNLFGHIKCSSVQISLSSNDDHIDIIKIPYTEENRQKFKFPLHDPEYASRIYDLLISIIS